MTEIFPVEWPFDQPPNCVAITTTQVLKEGRDITHVYHDEDDHGWQFHYPGEKSDTDAMVVAMKTVVEFDLRWTPKIGQEGSLSPNPTENDPHVQETTSA
jgi:hypothetical protein